MSGELNQVKWVGVRPVYPTENIQIQMGAFETTVGGVTRVQVNKSVIVNNTTTIIHTVTAAKVFYMVAVALCANPGVGKLSSISVRNAADVTQYTLLHLESSALQGRESSLPIFMPIAVPALYDIVLVCTNTDAHGFISGWEQAA